MITETFITNMQQGLEVEGVSPQTSMTLDNPSRKEVIQLIPLLTTKHATKIGPWNICTMYQAGKASQIAVEMKQYNLSIIGLSDIRWTQAGKTKLSSGETVIYSGHNQDNAPNTQGVGIMLSREAARSLMEWKAVSPRIITARLFSKPKKVTIIQCYSPTNDAEQLTKDNFYDILQQVINKQRKKDIILLRF